MDKGTSEQAIGTVVIIVIAVVALAVLWIILSGQTKTGTFGLAEMVDGFKTWFCDDFLKCKLEVGAGTACEILFCRQ